MQYEYGVWTKDEVESLKSEIYTITPEDEAELYRLNEQFAGNTANSNLVETMGKSLGPEWPPVAVHEIRHHPASVER